MTSGSTQSESLFDISSARATPHRTACALGAGFWLFIFIWLTLGATPLARILGACWALIGLCSPTAYLFSLALALPWFGNNPGGAHLLYLWDMGMMGCVAGHLLRRALGVAQRRPHRIDPWITLFIACTWVGVIPQSRWLRCEFLFDPRNFMRQIYTHYANAGTFSLRMALDATLSAGLYVALRDRPWPAARQLALLRTLLATLVFTALLGLLEYAQILSMKWWREDIAYSMRFGYRRLKSLFWDAGWMAEYLAPLAPLTLIFACAAPAPPAREGWHSRRAAWFALALLLALTQFLTMQRAGWLALAAAYATVALAWNAGDSQARPRPLLARLRPAALALGAVLLLGALLALLLPDFRHRAGELFVAQHRTGIWSRAWKIIYAMPLSGIGTGNFNFGYLYYITDDGEMRDYLTAHNSYLHIWAERGIFGLTFFLAIAGLAIAGLWRALRGDGDADRASRIVRAALLGGLVAMLVDGCFQYEFYVRAIETLFWIFIGWTTWVTLPGARPGGGPRRWPSWIIPCLSILMALSVVHENRGQLLRPWQIYVKVAKFKVGHRKVKLAIPPAARRLSLQVACMDPHLGAESPVVYTVKLGGQELARTSFAELGTRILSFDLPASRRPEQKLVVSVSRTWSPWAYGLGQSYPLLDEGVLYRDPVAENGA